MASAASAAAHPEGQPAESGPYEVMSPELFEVYELDPDLAYAPERLTNDWSWNAPESWNEIHRGPSQEDAVEERSRPAQEDTAQAEIVDAQEGATRLRPQTHAQAVQNGPAHIGVAKMPRSRPYVAHKRAQVDLSRVMPRFGALQMSHRTASGWLKNAGLGTKSTGACSSKHMRHCTSFDSVRAGTIARVIELKQASGCPIMVTGGTEEGHAPGQYSHGNGYKLDISHNTCIDRHITKNHQKAGVRSDGARLYRSASGTTFADESSHWDILFR
ncbi:hypothetical protein ACFOY2_52060 [Nonomuraea purpurea]|uniref:Peptidase M15A C-terminal domain-containing protein n=1 Tax=Nonomuraea purpurea TaxID=1849276 RepID=A0ABV8GPB4_9ACTN